MSLGPEVNQANLGTDGNVEFCSPMFSKIDGTVKMMSKERVNQFFKIARIFSYLDDCIELKNATPLEKSMAFDKALKILEPEYVNDNEKGAFKLTSNPLELSEYLKKLDIECVYPHGISNKHQENISHNNSAGIGSTYLELVVDRVVKRVKVEEANKPIKMVKPINADKIIDAYVKLDIQYDKIIIQRFIGFINSIIKEFSGGNACDITNDKILEHEIEIENKDFNQTKNQREFIVKFNSVNTDFKFIYDFKKCELVSFDDKIKFVSYPKPNIEPDTNVTEYLKARKTTPYFELPPLSSEQDKMMDAIDLIILWEKGYNLSACKLEQYQLNISSLEIGELVKYSDFSLAFEMTEQYLKSITNKAPVAILNLFKLIINEPLKRSHEHCLKVAEYILDSEIDLEKIYQTHLQNVSRSGLIEIAEIKLNELHSSEGYLNLQSLKLERALTNSISEIKPNLYIETEYEDDIEKAMSL